MQRKYLAQLVRWHSSPKRKPLIVRGARQVGKSTLVRQFAESEGLTLFEVNCERYSGLADVAASLDPHKVLREIEFICNHGAIRAGEALVFIDEIQEQPQLLQCLRYFYELMPELAVVSAGSLLEFALGKNTFPMPVGRVEYFYMGPVSWDEFLHAKGEMQLLELLASYEPGDDFPLSAHERLLGLLRDYLLIGGMPEAVQHFLDDGDLDAIFDIQYSIYQTYRDDFSKYAHGQALIRLQKIIDYMGQGTGRKVKYVNIDRESQSREVKQAVDLILKAGLVLQAVHTHGDGVPLGAQSDPKVSKLYSLDIGLYNRICNLRRLSEHEMRDTRFINEGMIAEQFIAQYLYFRETPKRKPDLHYWLREGSARNAEVDFLIQVGQKVVPVEIKSGKSGTLKSLFQFALEKRCQVACRFDLNLPSVQSVEQNLNGEVVALNLLSLPLYMCHEMERLING
tara:strand:+ start:231 stop:1592 length:1362 start_codon:yes stop_codon:yes gene_type:complete